MAANKLGATPTAMGLNRYVHVGFFTAGLILTYVLIMVVESLWSLVWATNDILITGICVTIATIATIYAWRHPRINVLAKEIATELSKVTWPTRKETSAFTVTVIVTTIISALILGLFDMFWAGVTGLVY